MLTGLADISLAGLLLLERNPWTFAEATKTRKRLSLTLITTYGLNRNIHSSGLVETVLTLDDFFLE